MNAEAERPAGPGGPGGAGEPPAGQPGPGDGGGAAGSVLNLERLSLSFGGLRALSELDLLVALVQVSRRWRTILLPPAICLASFVWETRLVTEPAITRQLMIGAILIVMMNARPQGLLGARRVETPI